MTKIHNSLKTGALIWIISAFLFMPATVRTEAAGVNLIANPSVETSSSSTTPVDWNSNSWGTLTPTFEYKTSGSDGTKSVYTSVANYSSGDAKWYFTPVTAKSNQLYSYTDDYMSSVSTSLFVWVIDTAGNNSYMYLGDVAASATWKQAAFTFTTPANTATISIFHVVAQNGYLWTDNFNLSETSTTTPVITNNVPNYSMEQVSSTDATLPLAWNKSSWGSLTPKFEYIAGAAKTGSKSLKVTVTGFTSGDAKWYFDYQPAVADVTYTFTDWYKSNVVTRVLVVVEKSDSTVQYIELANAAKSTAWKQYTANFTMPANAARFTVFHMIDKNGYLQVDDYSAAYRAPAIVRNGIPNNSFEQDNAAGTAPLGWTTSKWGTNASNFVYVKTGHTGVRSARINVTSYTDGDAKWVYDAQPVTPGTMWKFTNYYKSNVPTNVLAAFTRADGSIFYQGLPVAAVSTAWKLYTANFEIPQGAVMMTIYHTISAVGYLITDDYSLATYSPTGFQRGYVSLTFDDGWEENYFTILPMLRNYGFKSTQFYATTFIQNEKIEYLQAFVNEGHEVGSHSVTHGDMTKMTTAQLDSELSQSKTILEGIAGVGNVKNFATPFGAYNPTVVAKIKQYYGGHRSVDVGYNSKDSFTVDNVRVQNVLSTTTASEVQYWVNRAIQDNTWLVLVYHRVGTNPGAYDTTPELFSAQLQVIANSGIPVQTFNAGLNEAKAQM